MFSFSLIFLSSFALAVSVCNWPQKIPGLNNDQKKQVVNYHNQLRNLVASGNQLRQPPAENMKEMSWDNELEKSAQNAANRCIFKYYITTRGIGQNIYLYQEFSMQGVTNVNVSKYIDAWYSEVKTYTYGISDYSHYTQLIWANTNKIGCGYALSQDDNIYSLYFFCNYSPAGNYLGQTPYQNGESNCVKYGMKTSANYSSLCV